MHSHSPKTPKEYNARRDINEATLDANTSLAKMAAFVGERKKILDVGCASGYFAHLLSKRECDTVGIDANPLAVEEARKYCTRTILADLDDQSLASLLDERFDVVIFGDVLEHLREPGRVLDEARELLKDDGYVIASIPNVSHGAVRLALLSGNFDYNELGILDDTHMRFFTAKTIDELFLNSGYRIEAIERVTLPMFAESDLVPQVDARDFDPSVIDEIRRDPESETLQFVVKALPLSNDQRLRALSKRFLTVNTELAAVRKQLQHRDDELARAGSDTERVRAELELARARLQREVEDSVVTRGHLDDVRAQYRELESAYKALEIKSAASEALRGAVDVLERRLDVMTERAFSSYAGLEEALRSRDDVRRQIGEVETNLAAAKSYIKRLEEENASHERNATRAADAAAEVKAYVEQLKDEIASHERNGAEVRDYVAHVESDLRDAKKEIAVHVELHAELEAVKKAARSERSTLQAYVDDLRARSKASDEASAARLSEAQGRIAEVERHVEHLNGELALAGERKDALERDDAEARDQVLRLTEMRDTLGDRARRLEQQIATAEREGDEVRAALEKRSVLAEERLAAAQVEIAELGSTVDDGTRRNAELRTTLDEQSRRAEQQLAAAQREKAELRDALTERANEITKAFDDKARGLEQQLAAAQREKAELRDTLTERASEAETKLTFADEKTRGLEQQLASVRRERGELRDALIERAAEFEDKLAAAEREFAEVRDALGDRARRSEEQVAAAGDEIIDLRMRLEELDRANADLVEAVEAETRQAREYEREAERLTQECLEAGIHLEDVLLEKGRVEAELENVRATLTDDARTTKTDYDALQVRFAAQKDAVYRLEDEIRRTLHANKGAEETVAQLRSDINAQTVRQEALQTKLADYEQQLIVLTEGLVERTQAESARIATLIQVVQSSRFWRLKSWLAGWTRRSG